MEPSDEIPPKARRRRGWVVWLLTVALCGLSVLWAGLTPFSSNKGAKKAALVEQAKAPVLQIPQTWIQHLTPVQPPQQIRAKLSGTLLLEVLYRDGEALWTLSPKLWKRAQLTPDEKNESAVALPALRWPGARGGGLTQRERVLDIDDTPMDLLAPPTENCQVRWWVDGEPRSEAKGCDVDGSFELELTGVQGTQGWLELSYPGRLAAQIPMTLQGQPIDLGKVALGYGFSAGLKVTDPEGRPLAGVRTELRHYGMPDNGPVFRGQTNDEGEMQWSTLPAGAATVQLRLPGYRTQSITIGAPRERVVEAQMEPVQRLWGQVYMAAAARDTGRSEQELFEKVKVRLAGSGIWPPKIETCRSDGGFQFSEIPAGVYAIEAYVDDEDLQLASYPLENVPSDHAVSLSLLPAFELLLELLDDDGDPVQGAKVSARSNALGLLARECVSDEVGMCRLAALVPSSYQISVHAEGFLPRQQTLDRSLALDSSVHETLVWALEAAPNCVARVQRPDGRPLAMAQVWVRKDRGGPKDARDAVVAVGVSDADGFVGFDPLPPGRYRLGGRLDGWSMGKGHVFSPGPACENMTLTMQPAVRVKGTVFDDRGLAVVDASVQLRNLKGEVLARTRSDAQGTFELEDARGKVELVVRGTGYRPYSERLNLRRKEGDEQELVVTLEVVETGQLELALVDQEGEPRPELAVEFSDPKGLQDKIFARADRHGVVELDRLPLGKWTVRVFCEGTLCLRRTLKWEASDGVVQKKWTLKDPWQLVLTILDDVSEPIAGAGIRLGDQRMRSNEAGEAIFDGLWDDQVSLRVRAESFVTKKLKVKRPNEEGPKNKVVTLERAGAIEGEVLDAWGTPIIAAQVILRWDHGQAQVQSGPEGRFELLGVPQGDWTLEVKAPASRPDLPPRRVPVNVRPQLRTRDVFVTLGEL